MKFETTDNEKDMKIESQGLANGEEGPSAVRNDAITFSLAR